MTSGTRSEQPNANAIARWEGEGGASKRPPAEVDPKREVNFSVEEEHVLRRLGAAVLLEWTDLPTSIQRRLFESAASIDDPRRAPRLRHQIARFLHNHKNDEGQAT